MRKQATRIFLVLMIAMMFTTVVGNTTATVYAKSASSQKSKKKKKKINYQKRANKAKKNLVKKVTKLLDKDYHKPSCRIRKSKRKGRYLTCWLSGSIGEGACEGKVKVDLKTGVVTVVKDDGWMFVSLVIDYYDYDDDYDYEENGESLASYKPFKISVK